MDEPMMGSEAGQLADAFAQGGAEEREAAYATIEGVVRAASVTGSGGGDRSPQAALALVVPSVRPLIADVLCAPASRVGRVEYVRAAVLLYEMCKLDMIVVTAEMWRKDEVGATPAISIWTAPDTVLAEMLAKEPSEWTRDDAIVAAANYATHVVMWAAGGDVVLAEAATGSFMEVYADTYLAGCPFVDSPGDPDNSPQPVDRYVPLASPCLDLMRSEPDTQPEAIITGAGGVLCHIFLDRTNGKAAWDAGFLECFQDLMQRYNPMERISKSNLVPTGAFAGLRSVVRATQQEVIQPLLDAGALDIAITALNAYQMLGKPEQASVCAITWGVLATLEDLLRSEQARPIVTKKLRSAGVESFRYILDHPLVNFAELGLETGPQATYIAALTWGRDDDTGGLSFKQSDIETVVDWTRKWCAGGQMVAEKSFDQSISSLCVSDTNKQLLLNCEDFIPLLVDSLLLDPEHPRRAQPDFDAVSPSIQRDFVGAIAQLAMFPHGREALLQAPSVAGALQQVATEGWTGEARAHAAAALLAMSDKQPHVDHGQHNRAQGHIMLSYQWDVQAVVKLIVKELQKRGYKTWFDLDNMKGSTIDAMSEAVDHAEVMLSCISLAYKESSNCRLELQYAHEQSLLMIPLMMEQGYKATGWLGLIVGAKIWYPFYPAAVETDVAFMKQMDAVCRDLGERGKPKEPACRMSEGVPPASRSMKPSPAPAPAPASALRSPAPQAPAPAALAPALAPAVVPDRSSSFTPSIQMSSPEPLVPHQSVGDPSLLFQMFEREDKLRHEMNAKIDQLRQDMRPQEAVSAAQVSAVMARLGTLHLAQALSDDELFAIEDCVADFLEAKGGVDVVTMELVHANPAMGKVHKLVALSEGIADDGMFARQLKRKFV